jgi:Tol biopolymer transport system component
MKNLISALAAGVFSLVFLLIGCSGSSGNPEQTMAGREVAPGITERLMLKGLETNASGFQFVQVSPDARRTAYIRSQSNKQAAVIDGVEGNAYEKIEFLTFSADSQRVVYVATDITRKIIVLDGKEAAVFDYVDITNSPIFGPDSRYLAYVVRKLDVSGSGPNLWNAVFMDGVEGAHYNSIDGGPIFSPDGNHMVYVAGFGDGRQAVVTDGVQGNIDAMGIMLLTWSADSQKFIYRARPLKSSGEFIVINGVEGKQYNIIESPNFFTSYLIPEF